MSNINIEPKAFKTDEYISFKIRHGNGWVAGKNGDTSFKSFQEAYDDITEFKRNPKSHNEKMTNENIKYWSNETYTIEKVTTKTESLIII